MKDAFKKIINFKIKAYPVVVLIVGTLIFMGLLLFFFLLEMGFDFRLVPYPFGLILLIYCVGIGLLFSASLVYMMFFRTFKKTFNDITEIDKRVESKIIRKIVYLIAFSFLIIFSFFLLTGL